MTFLEDRVVVGRFDDFFGGRVEERRGGRRTGDSCSPAAFASVPGVSIRSIAPFPLPAHRTGRADFPHPALRLDSREGSRGRRPRG
jgi:hypothetical protein